MSDDRYLWDRGGTPDPDVQRLERTLGRLAHRGSPPEFDFEPAPDPERSTKRHTAWIVAAAAAGLVVVLGIFTWSRLGPGAESWQIASLEGTPRIGSAPLGDQGKLAVGQWLETGPGARARADLGTFGQIEIQPHTRMRLLRSRASEQRMALERGTVHAVIWAPPGRFFVETPSAVAVDLGCAYILSVDSTGVGLVRVTAGWVGFERDGLESFIPAGAACETRPNIGPGTPWFEDAVPEFIEALERRDFDPDPAARAEALATLLVLARDRDAVTLWHLLSRADGEERLRIFDRLAVLAPLPAGVSRDGVLAGDRRMLDLWWDSLGLGETALWRTWKGKWPGFKRWPGR